MDAINKILDISELLFEKRFSSWVCFFLREGESALEVCALMTRKGGCGNHWQTSYNDEIIKNSMRVQAAKRRRE